MWNISVNWAPHTHHLLSHCHWHTHTYALSHTLPTHSLTQSYIYTRYKTLRSDWARYRNEWPSSFQVDCHRTTAFWCEGHVDSPTVLQWDKISVFPRFSPAFACWFDRFWLCVPHTSVSRSFSLPVVRFFYRLMKPVCPSWRLSVPIPPKWETRLSGI